MFQEKSSHAFICYSVIAITKLISPEEYKINAINNLLLIISFIYISEQNSNKDRKYLSLKAMIYGNKKTLARLNRASGKTQ
ncbi:hypothetical protein DP202_12835 [Enterobacter cloacae]|uniref:Uncharacterized protein n=1 Tax=Enterobacter cloacae TaxID=550 RepID=A0A330GF17_ENTCL|nr:hypothetical protein DP202_12835 [Enterobacter cloacae]